jgi:2-C-methyl-D-erythritol 4-phosphate cytidylyltransferase
MVTGLVLAAGRSTRMGGGHNKQFLELLGQPLLWYSLAAFEHCAAVDEIILVRRPDYADQAARIAGEFKKVTAFADGGAERQNSVWNGLQKATGDIVAVHDGARPLVTPALIEATIQSARQHGTGIAATKVVDTIKEANPDRTVVRTVDRTKLWAVQTPQTVRTDLLRQAYRQVLDKGIIVTDEAAAVELLGQPVHLVETPFLNLKITTPENLPVVEALLRAPVAPGK